MIVISIIRRPKGKKREIEEKKIKKKIIRKDRRKMRSIKLIYHHRKIFLLPSLHDFALFSTVINIIFWDDSKKLSIFPPSMYYCFFLEKITWMPPTPMTNSNWLINNDASRLSRVVPANDLRSLNRLLKEINYKINF
jgi:hypothetical protein